MTLFRDIDSPLELAEAYAEECGHWADSEQAVSDRFDEHVAPAVVERYGADDAVAIREAFNDWTDSLTRDGELHPSQNESYCYVGKYAVAGV